MNALASETLSAGSITRVLATIAQVFDSSEGSEARIQTALELAHALVPYEQIGLIEEGAPEPRVLVLPVECPDTKPIAARIRRLFTLIAAEDHPSRETLSRILDGPQSEGNNWLAVPLVSCDRAIGLLLVSRCDGEYSERELGFLSIVSAHLAAYLTLRRLQEEERARLREEQTVNRRKDEFLAVLGHELRNPLGALRNGILAAQRDDNVRKQALEIAARQVQQLSNLANDLLDIAGIAEGKIHLEKQPTELAKTVACALESVRPLLEQWKHELTTSLPPRPVFIEADPPRLQQILTNLLSNAAKYTPPGGKIKLEVEQRAHEVVISVHDNGIGIAAEMMPQVFKLFTQLNRPLASTESGLGIGLALVQRLVTLHGGKVEVASAGLGEGATFSVRLPAPAAPSE